MAIRILADETVPDRQIQLDFIQDGEHADIVAIDTANGDLVKIGEVILNSDGLIAFKMESFGSNDLGALATDVDGFLETIKLT